MTDRRCDGTSARIRSKGSFQTTPYVQFDQSRRFPASSPNCAPNITGMVFALYLVVFSADTSEKIRKFDSAE